MRPPRRLRSVRGVPQGPAGAPLFDRTSLTVLFVFLFAMGIGATAGLLGGFQTLPPPSSFNTPFSSVLGLASGIAFLSLIVVALYVRLLRKRGGERGALTQGMGTTTIALFAMILVLAAIVAASSLYEEHKPHAVIGEGGPSSGSNNSTAGGGSGYNGNNTNATGGKGISPSKNASAPLGLSPPVLALAAGILLSLVIVPVVAYLARRHRQPEIWEPEPPPELVRTLEQAVASLEAGDRGEARTRIVAAYRALLGELERQRVAGLEHSTPREIEELMSSRLQLSSPSAHDLRTLFEEARYSEHLMSDEQAGSARRALSEVIEQLKSRPLARPEKGEGGAALLPGAVR